MALLFIDSFDHFGNNVNVADAGKWSAGGTNATQSSTSQFRTGTTSLSIAFNNTAVTKILAPADNGFVVGFARRAVAHGNGNDMVSIREGTTVHFGVGLTSTGAVTARRGTTVLATSADGVVNLTSWEYIEVKGTIHDSTGSYEIRVDGVNVLSGTGADTRNGGTGVWDRVGFAQGGSNNTWHVDDVYVCDTSGSTNNDFLGPVKVYALLPQTDAVAAGSNAGLTPSTGTDHGALVDETPPNTTDYNSSATVGNKDTYNFPAIGVTGSVLGLQTSMYVAKSDAVARQVCAVVRSGGTDYDGANVSPLTTFQYYSEMREVNPDTGVAWTISDVDAVEAGMKVTA
jgi:hypothetical protein